MKNLLKLASLVLLVVVVLAGCSPAQPVVPTAQPTQDLNVVRTEAAQTVVAGITAEALANPSATPTSAPTETATPLPLPTEPPAATATAAPVLPTSTRIASSGGGSALPARTATPYTDRAQWVSQSLPDGVGLTASQDFDMKWTVKNTGVRDWNDEFYYRYAGGDLEPSDRDLYFLPGVVKKNDTVELLVDFVAPSAPGRYTSNWELINDDGTAFFRFFIVINVR